jgi:hypothetical protein
VSHEQVWNIPYGRNSVFTGRERILVQLAEALNMSNVTALSLPHAISGLGGIGKTQIASEPVNLERTVGQKPDKDGIARLRYSGQITFLRGSVT